MVDDNNYMVKETADPSQAYYQLAAMVVIRAARDYLKFLLRPNADAEIAQATDIFKAGWAANKAIVKRLKKEPDAIGECREFLLDVICENYARGIRTESYSDNCKALIGRLNGEVTADELLACSGSYAFVAKGLLAGLNRTERLRQEDARNCYRFLTDGRVELYTNGKLDSEALMAEIQRKANKVLQARGKKHGKGPDNQRGCLDTP